MVQSVPNTIQAPSGLVCSIPASCLGGGVHQAAEGQKAAKEAHQASVLSGDDGNGPNVVLTENLSNLWQRNVALRRRARGGLLTGHALYRHLSPRNFEHDQLPYRRVTVT